MKEQVHEHGTVYYEDRKVCNLGDARYRTELAKDERYPLDTGFVAAACQLSTDFDESTYMTFLDTWGTVRAFTHIVISGSLSKHKKVGSPWTTHYHFLTAHFGTKSPSKDCSRTS